MAMTSRDIMFVLRAQDFVTRELRGLGGAFSRLDREMQVVNNTMRQGLNASQVQLNKELIASRNNIRATIAPMQEQNKAMAVQNAALQQQKVLNSQGLTQQQGMIGIRQQQLSQAQRLQSVAKEELGTLQQKISQNRILSGQTQSERDQMVARVSQLQKEIAARQQSINTLKHQTAGHQGRVTVLDKERQAIDRQLAQNKLVSAQNSELISKERQAAQVAQESARSRAVAREEAIRREADLHRQRIAHQQELIAKIQATGVAMVMMGAILSSIGAKGVSSLKDMVFEAAEFQQGMALALTQVDGLNATIGDLVRIGRQVGREVPADLSTMTETLYFIFSSMNVNLEESQHLLRGFAREAVAGNSSIEAAAKSTIAILNGMNLSVSDLTRVQDFQFQTVRKGVITYDQLASNIGKLIPSLRRAGQEIETGGAMLGFLTRNGLSAEMATTAAARSLELMADPRVVSRLEAMGFTVRDATGEFRPLVDVLGQLADQWGHLPAPERAQKMLDVFGGAGYRIQARRFFDVVLPNFEDFRQHIEWQIGNVGALDRAYDIMFEQPLTKIQRLSNIWSVFRMEIGDALFPVLDGLIGKFEQLVGWFDNMTPTQKESIAQFAALGAAAAALSGTLLILGGSLIIVIGLLAKVTGGIAAATFLAVGLPAILTAIVAGLGYVALSTDGVSGAWQNLIGWFTSAEGAVTIAVGAFAFLLPILLNSGGAMTTLTGIVIGLSTLFKEGLPAAIARTKTALMGLATSHPILLGLALAITAVAATLYLFRRRSKEAREATKAHTEALNAQIDVISGSIEGFENYQKTLQKTNRETVLAALKEKDLMGALNDSARAVQMSSGEMINAATGERKERERLISTLEAQYSSLSDASELSKNNAIATNGMTDAQIRYRDALGDLIPFVKIQNDALIASERAMRDEMRARGGVSELIADYIDLQEHSNTEAIVRRALIKDNILAYLELTGGLEGLNEAERNALLATDDFNEVLEESMGLSREYASVLQNLSNVMSGLIGVNSAWVDALNKANEGLEEPKTSLAEFTNGFELWMDSLEEGHEKSRGLWTDMYTVMVNNTDLMTEDLALVTTAILGMGVAGPDAMAMLANADPEDFMRMLRMIRYEAALSSETVQNAFDELLIQLQALAVKHGPAIEDRMGDIFEAVTVTMARHTDMSAAEASRMMELLADAIAAGHDPVFEEMVILGDIMAEMSREGGARSAVALTQALGLETELIREVANTYGIVFTEEVAASVGRNLDISGPVARQIQGGIPAATRESQHLGSRAARAANDEMERELTIPNIVRDALMGSARIADQQGTELGSTAARNAVAAAKANFKVDEVIRDNLMDAAALADEQGTELGRSFSHRTTQAARERIRVADEVKNHLTINAARVADAQGTEYGRAFSERMNTSAEQRNQVGTRISTKLSNQTPLMLINGTSWGRTLADWLNTTGTQRTRVHTNISSLLTRNTGLFNTVGTLWGIATGSNLTSRATGSTNPGSIRDKLRGFVDRIAAVGTTWGQRLAAAFNNAAQANIQAPTMPSAGGGGGGSVTRNTGGIIPGRGPNRDSVWAYVTPGEYVLRRSVADRLGVHRLNQLNLTGDPRTLMGTFNKGGAVYNRRGPNFLNGGGHVTTTNNRSETKTVHNEYNYMPGAEVKFEDPADVEIEIRDFEHWLRRFDP